MEREYKWKLPEGDIDQLLTQLAGEMIIQGKKATQMRAIYYDSGAGIISGQRGALRLRQEGETSVCCMKLPSTIQGACSIREEYEVTAQDIQEGLTLLPSRGAPQALCDTLRQQGLWELCHIDFVRTALQVEVAQGDDSMVAELSVDMGQVRGNGRTLPIAEVEFELHSGNETLFHQVAQGLAEKFSLQNEPLSKMARILVNETEGVQ